MTKRIAKKILRNINPYNSCFKSRCYTEKQISNAHKIMHCERFKCRNIGFTAGFRFGRWDPNLPSPPDELPF